MHAPFSSAGQDSFADLREMASMAGRDLSSGSFREKAFFFSRISSCSLARAITRSRTAGGTCFRALRR